MDKRIIAVAIAMLVIGLAVGYGASLISPAKVVTTTTTATSPITITTTMTSAYTILSTVPTTITTTIPLTYTVISTNVIPTTITSTIPITHTTISITTAIPTTVTLTPPPITTTVTARAPITVVDALNRSIEFSEPPRRVVSAMPSITEILFALGLGNRVVGVDTYSNYPPEVLKLVNEGKIQTVGGPWTLDLEKIASLKPDLVLLSVSPHAKLLDKFNELGLKTVFLKSNKAQNAYDIYSDIMLVAKIFGVEDRGWDLISSIDKKIMNITLRISSIAPKPRVLHLVGPPSWGLYSAGGDTFIGWLIQSAGGDNIAKQYSGWPQLSYEFILSKDPEIIIITVHGVDPKAVYDEVIKTPLINTTAWKNKAVYVLMGEADDMISRPGPRVAGALEILAHLIYPDIFGPIRRSDVVNITLLRTVMPIILR